MPPLGILVLIIAVALLAGALAVALCWYGHDA